MALNVFAAIAVCFGTGGAAVGAGTFGLGVGADECVGEGVGVGAGVGVGVAVGVGVGAGAAVGTADAGDEAAGAGADVEAGAGVASLLARLVADDADEVGVAMPPWPLVQAAQVIELNATAARSGSSGRPGRDRQGPRRDTGTRPG